MDWHLSWISSVNLIKKSFKKQLTKEHLDFSFDEACLMVVVGDTQTPLAFRHS